MNVTITFIICLSLVFVITLGIVSCTLRDKNFKVRFDDRNKRLSRIIQEQRDELISYREAIKKNDANLERSLEVLASASNIVNKKVSRPSYLSPEEKKNFMEYMQACSEGYAYINKDKIFVTLEDVKTALECVGTNNWGRLYDIIPSEEEPCHGQNTERNQ